MTGLSSGGSHLLNPEQRMATVPVTCTAHSGGFGWRGLRVEDYPDLPPSDIRCAGMNAHLLVYHTRALDGEFHHECADRTTRTRLRTGELSFIPARADNRWLFGEGRPCAIHLMIDEDLFARNVAQDDVNPRSDLRDDFQFTSPELQALVRLFALELANGGLNGPLYIEALGIALSHRIMREFGAASPPAATNQSGSALARAIELIHQEYYRVISLDELAGVTGLSRAQFIRRFRAAFGKAPHAYLIDYRIAVARQRLSTARSVSFADLALELGFADQSHFYRHFRALTGTSPAAFRRSRLT